MWKAGVWVDESGPWSCRRDAVDYTRQLDRPMRVVRRKTVVANGDYVLYNQKENPNK